MTRFEIRKLSLNGIIGIFTEVILTRRDLRIWVIHMNVYWWCIGPCWRSDSHIPEIKVLEYLLMTS